MADTRYYPYVPWDDQSIHADVIYHDCIHADVIYHDCIHADVLSREGIFGPLAQVLMLLKADVRYLKAQDNKRLAVLQDVYT